MPIPRLGLRILQTGHTPPGIAVARAVGVANPERIRVLEVLGYGIFIVPGQLDLPLLSHECRHVHQVEAAGSLEAFLPLYLRQIAGFYYDHAPHEIDACQHELSALPPASPDTRAAP